MPSPDNGIYIIVGEMNMVMTAMKKSGRWSSHAHQEDDQDVLLRSFSELKEILKQVTAIGDVEPTTYLTPFLDVIRAENTTGLVTGLGLSAVSKFLSYGLIDAKHSTAPVAAENIADAVTHARFMGTDSASDEVVLMKILHVLRLLLLTPLGVLLTNESVCEIMQSCFRICFETRLSELLRRSAEDSLTDMVQLLFSCLPQFTEDTRCAHIKKLKMRSGILDTGRGGGAKNKRSPRTRRKKVPMPPAEGVQKDTPRTEIQNSECVQQESCAEEAIAEEANLTAVVESRSEALEVSPEEEPVVGCSEKVQEWVDTQEKQKSEEGTEDTNTEPYSVDFSRVRRDSEGVVAVTTDSSLETDALNNTPCKVGDSVDVSSESGSVNAEENSVEQEHSDYVNPRGVRFTPHKQPKEGSGPLVPYGLPCVRELFRYLVCLVNPHDRHNSDTMVQVGLNLLTVALEAGADSLGRFTSFLTLIRDETCRNLFALLSTDRLTVFTAALRVCFLLFEALRTHLKFQLEMFLKLLMETIVTELSKSTYEQKEISLEYVAQLWRIPGLVTELYINYDCDLYCANIFEDFTKMLSKNAYPLSGLYSINLLSLEALLAVIENIESHCQYRMMSETQFLNNRSHNHPPTEQHQHHPGDVDVCGVDASKRGVLQQGASGYLLGQELILGEERNAPRELTSEMKPPMKPLMLPNRMKISPDIPSHERLMAVKHKKKILLTGTEQFNSQPSKGVLFLQEHGLLGDPLDPQEVAMFLRDNPQLDKKMIGEYISNRKNLKVLEAFVRSFAFEGTRIDEALRQYLETFRLPGEAPLISLIMEHFAEHWHKSNGEPFFNSDAAFTLAYAIIMLNVDQHNHNVKKQNIPMTIDDFKKNLKGVNGGNDFEQTLLEEIYVSIKNEEIVMPAEQTGMVRENYLWKVLLRRGVSREGVFVHTPNGLFDHDLFSLVWGPSLAALSFVFDKGCEAQVVERATQGFRKCATIAAYYAMSDVFDNLVISLCKFSTINSTQESPKTLALSLGSNTKAQLATRAMFRLVHHHGDILREGWRNILDCVLQLYRASLLPNELLEAEDFVHPKGVVSLVREDTPAVPRPESGLFSSFYSYITLTSDSPGQRQSSQEEESARQSALACVSDCHCEQIFTESKFLRVDALQELTETLIFVCSLPDPSNCSTFDQDSTVFLLELLVKIVLLNRDRVLCVWSSVRDHLVGLIVSASDSDHTRLLERSVVALLRIAIRLIRKEEMIPQVLESLKVLLYLRPSALYLVSRQVAYALHELLRTNAANVHSAHHWALLFSLLERVGAGTKPPRNQSARPPSLDASPTTRVSSPAPLQSGAQSDSELSRHAGDSGYTSVAERGYTSDSGLYADNGQQHSHQLNLLLSEHVGTPQQGGWTLVNRNGEIEGGASPLPVNQYNIVLHRELLPHDPYAFLKCCESLAFLVRDVAHVTPENFQSCVHCIRTFVEASTNNNGSQCQDRRSKVKKEKKGGRGRKEEKQRMRSSGSSSRLNEVGYEADDEEKPQEFAMAYQQVSLQLLDLMHTLHTRASSIYASEADRPEVNLWSTCWCPLLQGMARLCCDARRPIRTAALTLLPRALLVHDLQTLTPLQWEACFNKVLFPLLAKLLENIHPEDPLGMEETRMRGATLLCKVFLQHLSPLLSVPTFMALWLTILEFMDKYMHADGSDLLAEAIPESLKNMLLVMDTAGVFECPEEVGEEGGGGRCQMWHITWDRINAFLPTLKEELFKQATPPPPPQPPPQPLTTTAVEEVPAPHPEVPPTTEPEKALVVDPVVAMETPLSASPFSEGAGGQLSTPVSVILHPPTSPVFSNVSASLSLPGSSLPLLFEPVTQTDMPIFTAHQAVQRDGATR